MLSPNGQVIMISGANRGIGSATAQVLSNSGFRLSLGARDPDNIDTSNMDGETLAARWDATDADSSRQWAAETASRFRQIDGIVMNAGIFLSAGLEDEGEAAYDQMWAVNFKGRSG